MRRITGALGRIGQTGADQLALFKDLIRTGRPRRRWCTRSFVRWSREAALGRRSDARIKEQEHAADLLARME